MSLVIKSVKTLAVAGGGGVGAVCLDRRLFVTHRLDASDEQQQQQ